MKIEVEKVTIDGVEYIKYKKPQKCKKIRQYTIHLYKHDYLVLENSGWRGNFIVDKTFYTIKTKEGKGKISTSDRLEKIVGQEDTIRIFIGAHGFKVSEYEKVDVCLKKWQDNKDGTLSLVVDYPIFSKKQTAATAA